MPQNKISQTQVVSLNMNGLRGHMLQLPMPAGRNRDILLIYDLLSSIEEYWVLAETLNAYGAVTLPNLPGLGGMESFYKIGSKPSLDALADYLATFVRWRYKRRRLTVIAVGFGFAIATRMLQSYPELVKKVDLVISLEGFVHHEDLKLNQRQIIVRKNIAPLGTGRRSGWVIQHVLAAGLLRSFAIELKLHNKRGWSQLSKSERKEAIKRERVLWQQNDLRTYLKCQSEAVRLDLCRAQVPVPLHHIFDGRSRRFNTNTLKQHLLIVYPKVKFEKVGPQAHKGIVQSQSAARLITSRLRRALARPVRRTH